MKIEQENPLYKPITITLEEWHEAKALFGIIDKAEVWRCNAENPKFTHDEIKMLIDLSDALTNQVVSV